MNTVHLPNMLKSWKEQLVRMKNLDVDFSKPRDLYYGIRECPRCGPSVNVAVSGYAGNLKFCQEQSQDMNDCSTDILNATGTGNMAYLALHGHQEYREIFMKQYQIVIENCKRLSKKQHPNDAKIDDRKRLS